MSGDLKDLSLGYQAKLVPTGDGRLKQKNIVINHLAIVPEGRAEFARIVDGKPEDMKGESTEMGLFSKKENENQEVQIQDAEQVVEEKMDDESVTPYALGIGKQAMPVQHDEEVDEQEMQDDEESDKEHLEKEIGMKDYQHFMNQYKEIKDMPAGEFRVKAYDQANKECMDALGVSLPMLDSKPKASVIEKSVGLADNLTVKEEDTKPRAPRLNAQGADDFYDRLYRSFDYKTSNPSQGKENAKKYGDMDYRDVIDMVKKGGIK
jgi:hypothetical protein